MVKINFENNEYTLHGGRNERRKVIKKILKLEKAKNESRRKLNERQRKLLDKKSINDRDKKKILELDIIIKNLDNILDIEYTAILFWHYCGRKIRPYLTFNRFLKSADLGELRRVEIELSAFHNLMTVEEYKKAIDKATEEKLKKNENQINEVTSNVRQTMQKK